MTRFHLRKILLSIRHGTFTTHLVEETCLQVKYDLHYHGTYHLLALFSHQILHAFQPFFKFRHLNGKIQVRIILLLIKPEKICRSKKPRSSIYCIILLAVGYQNLKILLCVKKSPHLVTSVRNAEIVAEGAESTKILKKKTKNLNFKQKISRYICK